MRKGIEAACHSCIFLPKFHCELIPVEFFWGMVKKYLRGYCDYTFDALKENMPKACSSANHSQAGALDVPLDGGLQVRTGHKGTKNVQVQVHKFSSATYKSHRCIPDAVASAFD